MADCAFRERFASLRPVKNRPRGAERIFHQPESGLNPVFRFGFMKLKSESNASVTNLLLGTVAAGVCLLAARAIVRRQEERAAVEGDFPKLREPAFTSSLRGDVAYLLGEAVRRCGGMLTRLFSSAKTEIREGAARARERVAALRSGEEREGGISGENREEDGTDEEKRRPGTPGIVDRLEDPAWAGVLASHDGDVHLAQTERAVPMPESTRLVERLDKNPFIGKGVSDKSRNGRTDGHFPPKALKIPGATGDR